MNYAIVDIETTGGHASANGITEISVFIHDGERVIKHFETLINPQQLIPKFITSLTGIDNAMVATAPVFDEIADVLFEMLNNNVFIAHNVNFDYSFVKHQFKQSGYDLTAKKLCTVRLGRKVFPGLPSYSLGNLCRSLKIKIENRHRAGGDAKATVKLFEYMLANGAQTHIDLMLKRTSAEHWLPMNLDKEVIDKLPSKPGVYYFHNSKDKIIYVGKAISLKKRVSSHFTHNNPDLKRQNFIRNIYKVSYKQCATELEAIVFESTEIKRLWPRYNKSQKQPLIKYALYSFEDNRGYIRLAIDKKKKNLPHVYNFNLLNEGLVLLKKMVAQFDLNARLCFIDKTPFTKKEDEALEPPGIYNLKIKKALDALSENLSTFVLVDEGIKEEEKLCLLVERGSFWGMGYLPKSFPIGSSGELKHLLNPYTDNDYIRNNIYAYAEANPHKRIQLTG